MGCSDLSRSTWVGAPHQYSRADCRLLRGISTGVLKCIHPGHHPTDTNHLNLWLQPLRKLPDVGKRSLFDIPTNNSWGWVVHVTHADVWTRRRTQIPKHAHTHIRTYVHTHIRTCARKHVRTYTVVSNTRGESCSAVHVGCQQATYPPARPPNPPFGAINGCSASASTISALPIVLVVTTNEIGNLLQMSAARAKCGMS